ncbi:BNR repeat-containing protein [Pontiellaceae bacterium B12227]|nr:BNR repeat-containing protein [Pontiellaceae bacterium B12227]
MINKSATNPVIAVVLFRQYFLVLLATLLTLVPARLSAQISITKIGESLIGNSAQTQNATTPLNLRPHQDDAIVSFNGYQYCVYYSTIGANTAQRYVTVGRRALPSGAWETIMLTDYTQTKNDSHNVICIGICEGDGTIHLAFDHHNEDLNYRISIQGLATNPQVHSWVASKFNAVQDNLPGLDMGRTTGLTYPRFFPKPNGDLQFVRRKGSAIAGKSMLYTYSQTTHQWTSHGVYIDGTLVLYHNNAGELTKLNGYLHGIGYDDAGRLHASWVWRTTDGKNFNFMYAYSDNSGTTWHNNAGQQAGTVNSDPMTLSNSPPVKVLDYAEGSLYNQTGQTVDSVGRVHVVQRKGSNFLHIYRDTSGNWVHNETSIPSARNKITTDQHNNVYLITSSAKIYAATPGNGFTDWALAYDGDAGNFAGDAIFDESRMKTAGILSILAAKPGSSKEMYSIDLSVSPVVQPVITLTTLGTPVDLTDGSVWSDGSPAHSWADYVVPDTGNLKSENGTSVFPGASLTVEGGGKFQFRAKHELGESTTVNDLIATGGTSGKFVNLSAGTGNNIANHLDGTLQNDGFTRLSGYGNATGPRNIRISSKISGTGVLHSTGTSAYPHTCTIANPNNTFSGVWESSIGMLTFENGGAVGAADIEVLAEGKLRISGDWSSGASLAVADSATAEVDFGSNDWTVSNLVFGAAAVPDGTYSAAGLNALGANAVFTGTGTILVGDPLPPPVVELIAGWDIWNSGATPAANVVATDIAASAVTTSEDPVRPWHVTDERGASADGSWGTFVGIPSASTVTNADNENLELPNAVTGGTLTFSITNAGMAAIELDAFHFDAYAFRSKAARTYELSVLTGGGITPGVIYTSGAQEITNVNGAWDNFAHDNIDHSLAGLADNTLGVGESVQLRLTFSGGAGDASGGHDLWVDNVGITGAFQPVAEPPVLEHGMDGGDLVFNWIGGGFKVQSRTNLVEEFWIDVPEGDVPPVSIVPSEAEAFFRLIEQ